MSQTIDDLLTRRSVRQFKSDMVPAEVLDRIVQAGLYAPTGMNNQNTIVLQITDKKLRDELSQKNREVMGGNSDPFYGAPIVLVVLANKNRGTYLYDGSLTMGNLLNAAHALDVDSCWIHRAKEVFESDWGKSLLKSLGIQGEWEGIGNCILGYRDCDYPDPAPRKGNRVYKI